MLMWGQVVQWVWDGAQMVFGVGRVADVDGESGGGCGLLLLRNRAR